MPLRVGILSVAHLHAGGYVSALRANPRAELIGAWDDRPERLEGFDLPRFDSIDDLLGQVDAVVICSENLRHAEFALKAAEQGKHILCEKPLVAREEDARTMLQIGERVKVMTAFPCRYSPAFVRLRERVAAGDIGKIQAICATNRGRCPFSWFVERESSGGGAMIDHTVHVADLLRVLLQDEVVRVQAQIGHNLYGKAWEDTAMLTLEFAGGVFATLDSSWSRSPSYKTWGDVTMNVVGDKGVIELDMFNQTIDRYGASDPAHGLAGYGSNLDAALVDDFVSCCLDDRPSPIPASDGVVAARVALAGYESASGGMAVSMKANNLSLS